MNKLSQIEWFRKAGVEFTRVDRSRVEYLIPKHIRAAQKKFVPRYDAYYNHLNTSPVDKWRNDISSQIMTKVDEFDNMYNSHPLIHEVGYDPCCIEISSEPLMTWKELNSFFTLVDDYFCEPLFLKQNDYVCGTGGHIHVSINDKFEAYKVIRAVMQHPEVMFAFTNPSDDQHPLCNLYENVAKQDQHYIQTAIDEDRWYRINYYNKNRANDEKCGPVAFRGNYGTVEFRLLDVAQNWEMQEEHMAFVQQFMRYALSDPFENKSIPYREEIESRSVDDHVNNFLKLIKKIGLPLSRYREYYPDMIELRFKWKTANFD